MSMKKYMYMLNKNLSEARRVRVKAYSSEQLGHLRLLRETDIDVFGA